MISRSAGGVLILYSNHSAVISVSLTFVLNEPWGLEQSVTQVLYHQSLLVPIRIDRVHGRITPRWHRRCQRVSDLEPREVGSQIASFKLVVIHFLLVDPIPQHPLLVV